MEALYHAIKKDVRNNPIVREVDEARQRDLWKSGGVAALLVLLVLFSAWQHFELLRHGYQVEEMQREQRESRRRTSAASIGWRSRRLRSLEADRSAAGQGRAAPGPVPPAWMPFVIERVHSGRTAGHRPWSHAGETPRFPLRQPPGSPAIGLIRRALRRTRRAACGSARDPAPTGVKSSRIACSWWPAFLSVWVVGAEARLVYLQVAKRADMVARAERQHMRTIDAPAKRGDIVDRKGRVLATSVDADTIYAVPSEIGDATATVAALCRALTDCVEKERATLLGRFTHRGSFTYVRRQVSPDQKHRVEQLNLDGVGFMKENKRFYPNKELGAHVLGAAVGIDNNGLNGLEAAYELADSGAKGGRVLVQTDAKRHAFSRFERPPTIGSTIELTIDEYLQHIVERELHATVSSPIARPAAARSS